MEKRKASMDDKLNSRYYDKNLINYEIGVYRRHAKGTYPTPTRTLSTNNRAAGHTVTLILQVDKKINEQRTRQVRIVVTEKDRHRTRGTRQCSHHRINYKLCAM